MPISLSVPIISAYVFSMQTTQVCGNFIELMWNLNLN